MTKVEKIPKSEQKERFESHAAPSRAYPKEELDHRREQRRADSLVFLM